MEKITTSLLMVLMTMTLAFGQTQKATTENGKKVILNSDGTWKYTDTVKTAQTNLDPNDCSNWIKTEEEEDKVSGKSYTKIMKDYLLISKYEGKEGFRINLMLSGSNSIIFSIKAVGSIFCIEEGAKINILFTDGTRMKLASDGDMNCKGNATVYFGGVFGKKSQLNELKGKKIDTMRVWAGNSYVEQKFEDDQAEQFKNALNCLTK